MKPSERIQQTADERLRAAFPDEANLEVAINGGASVLLRDVVAVLDELDELERKRFEFTLQVIEDGEVTKLKELAREKGLL